MADNKILMVQSLPITLMQQSDTESVDAGAYWRKLKQRLKTEGNETVKIVTV